MDDLTRAVGDRLGAAVTSIRRVSGGDVAESFRFDLDDGRRVFAKTHLSAPPGFFPTEAAGLQWLAEAHAVRVPEVLAVNDDRAAGPPFLVLDWIDFGSGSGDPGTEAEFGRALAELHRAGAPSFGREDRATTGSRRLPNDPCETWAGFYRTRRLLPLARLANDDGVLADATIGHLERVADRLEDLGGPDEPPARLHGDLWAGNRLIDQQGHSVLIDPAAHGGHREFDLAMMRLFGGFGDGAYASYDDTHPLAAGWPERVALHQIGPLVVHAIKFGGSYVDAATAAIRRYA